MKKLLSIITVLLLGILLVSCKEKEVTINFDSNGGNKINSALIKNVNELDVSLFETPSKEGYKFIYWSVDGKNLSDVNIVDYIKDNNNITLKANYKELTKTEYLIDKISNIDYSNLLNENIEFNLNLSEDEIIIDESITNDSEQPSLKINNLKLDVRFKSNFKTYEDSTFLFEFNLSTKEIETDMFGFFSPLLFEVGAKQSFYLKEGNIYSSFNGNYKDASGEVKPLSEFVDFFDILVLPNFPIDIQDIIKDNYDLVDNYKEVKLNAFTKEIYDELKETIISLDSLIETIITIDLITNSNLEFDVNKDNLSFKLNNDEIIKDLNINVLLNDNKIKKIDAYVNFKEYLNNEISFSLNINQKTFKLEALEGYEEVDELRLDRFLS